MSQQEWRAFVAFFELLKKLPAEKQNELYFMSEGAKLVAESETA